MKSSFLRLAAAALAILVIAVAAYLAWSHRKPADSKAAPPPAQAVSLVRAQKRDVPVTVEAAGSVVPLSTVEVRAQVAAIVRTVAVKDGQFVRQGDLLFTFDDRADRANLAKAREQSLRDQASAADLQRQWQRTKDLLAQNFVSQSALDTARAALDAQQAVVRADAAAVQAAEVALGYDTVRAPLSGRAGASLVYPGSLVQPGGGALLTISQIDPIGVSFTVPEAQVGALLAGLKEGSAVTVQPSASAPGMPAAAPLEGRLRFVDNAIDAGTGTIRAKAEFANPLQQLWPGQYVTARLKLRTLVGATVVPQAALIQTGSERGVYVAGPGRKAQWRRVEVRYPFGELAVVDGVVPGDAVVVEGKQDVRPGSLLKEVAPHAAASAASTAATGDAP